MTEPFLRLERTLKVMGGPATLAIDTVAASQPLAANALDTAVRRLEALESKYSRYLPDSLISTINRRSGSGRFTPLDAESHALIALAGELWTRTDGLFDATSGVLRGAWDMREGSNLNPDRLSSLLPKVGWSRVLIEEQGVLLPVSGMEIDLGGLVKEFAVDDVAALLRSMGIESALIELAGDVYAIGKQGSGQSWQVGIANPCNPEKSLIGLELCDAAVATSGTYARRKQHEGATIHHLLDPRTGMPVVGPRSVTVIDAHCLTAGAVATVACLNSTTDAQQWLRDSELPWLMDDGEGGVDGPLLSACD